MNGQQGSRSPGPALLSFISGRKPDIVALEEKKDISRLIRLLSHNDFGVQWRAAEALERIGTAAVDMLHSRLWHGGTLTKIGIIEALSVIRDPSSIAVLVHLLENDRSNEVRWVSAVALGEMETGDAIVHLAGALRDADKYVRYGAAKSLEKLEWNPETPEDQVRFLVAKQAWSSILGLPSVPIEVLIDYLGDRDPRIRVRIVELLGMLGDPAAVAVCDRVLQDTEPEVRWKATLAFPQCRIPVMHLPRALAGRKKVRKNPYVASFLNFFFLGLGYNYLGIWWGFLLFQINLTAILTLSLIFGTIIPYLLSLTVSSVAVVHTWRLVAGMPDI